MWDRSTCDRDMERQLNDARAQLRDAEERLSSQQEAYYREREETRRQRQAERAERWNYERRHASTWIEALQKQAELYGFEAHIDGENDDVGPMFIRWLAEIERALEMWAEESQKVAPQIEALEAQIAALKDGIRLAVADRLEAEIVNGDLPGLLREIEEGDAAELSAWLDW